MIYNHSNDQELDSMTCSATEATEVSSEGTNLLSWLSRLWNSARQIMVVTDELQVWQRRDRTGKTFYHVHDPSTGRSIYCATEDEVRIWLEQSY